MQYQLNVGYQHDTGLVRNVGQGVTYGLLLLALATAPWWASPYWLSQIGFVLIYGVAGLGLMLLAGYTGLISVGHAAFFGIGAYAQAYFSARGFPFPIAIILSGTLAGLAGIVVGLPALRVRGIYLAVATLAFGFIMEEIMARWESVTGGSAGTSVKLPSFLGWVAKSPEDLYWLTLAVTVLVTLGLLNLLRSAIGRAFIAIRDSEISAQSMGIDLAKYKTLAFCLSSAIVGVAGAMYAQKLRFIAPDQFGIIQSVDLLLLIFVGGIGSIQGAFLGAAFLIGMPQLIELSKDLLPPAVGQTSGLQAVVFGIVLIAFILMEPRGIYGRWLKVRLYLELFPTYRKGTFRRQKSFQKSERAK